MPIDFGFILKGINWLLMKAGYKIVSIDDWKIEEMTVRMDFPDNDPELQNKIQAGAKIK